MSRSLIADTASSAGKLVAITEGVICGPHAPAAKLVPHRRRRRATRGMEITRASSSSSRSTSTSTSRAAEPWLGHQPSPEFSQAATLKSFREAGKLGDGSSEAGKLGGLTCA